MKESSYKYDIFLSFCLKKYVHTNKFKKIIYFILANFQLTGLKSNENDHSKTTIITIEPPELQNESQNQGKKYLLNLERRLTYM